MAKHKQNSIFNSEWLIQKLLDSLNMSFTGTGKTKETENYQIDDKIVHIVVDGGLRLYLAKLNRDQGQFNQHLSNNIDNNRKAE